MCEKAVVGMSAGADLGMSAGADPAELNNNNNTIITISIAITVSSLDMW